MTGHDIDRAEQRIKTLPEHLQEQYRTGSEDFREVVRQVSLLNLSDLKTLKNELTGGTV